jgi:integrase
VQQLIEQHLKDAKLGFKTRKNYSSQAGKHVLPRIGHLKVRAVDARVMDSFYSELRRCRDHCDGRPRVQHRTPQEHQCDHRCKPHVCRALSESSILYIHQILSGAFRRAVRLRWLSVNPIDFAEPPAAPKANPRPPSVEEAARIVAEAWKDPDWGTLVWLTMVTGNRRGELCGIRWRHLDLNAGVLHLQRAIGQYGKETWEKGTKNEGDRRIVLDPDTVLILIEHKQRCVSRARALGLEIKGDSFVFSRHPAGADHLKPDSVTQRYGRLAARLGIETSIHKLRTYNATELLREHDVRLVSGRLGHGSGGVTTMRHYSAWVTEADQRAAGIIAPSMPARPEAADLPPRVQIEARYPYEGIATKLQERIYSGDLPIGLPIPSAKALGKEYGVSPSTAQRGVQLLEQLGLVRIEPDRPTLVQPRVAPTSPLLPTGDDQPADEVLGSPQQLDVEILRLGLSVASFRTQANPRDSASLHRLLLGALKRQGARPDDIDEFELVVRAVGDPTVVTTYVAMLP